MRIRRSAAMTRPAGRLRSLLLLICWAGLLAGLVAYRMTHPSSAIPLATLPDPNLGGISHFLSAKGDTVQLEALTGRSSVAFVSSSCRVCLTRAASLKRTLERLRTDEWYMVVLDGPRGVQALAADSTLPLDRLLLPLFALERADVRDDGFVSIVPTVVRYHDGRVVRAFAGVPGPLWAWMGRAGSGWRRAGGSGLNPARARVPGEPPSSCPLVPALADAVMLPPIDRGELLYDRVRAAFFLGDSSVVIAGRTSLALYDHTGRLVRRIGREGPGPGEFREIDGSWPHGRQEILVVQRQQGRQTVFREDGSIVSDGPLAWGPVRGRWPVTPLDGRRWLLIDSESADVPQDRPGPRAARVSLLVWQEDAVDTIVTVEGSPMYEDWTRFARDRYVFSAPLPFGPSPGWAVVRGQQVAVTTGRDPTISVFDLNSGEVVGTLQISPTRHPPSEPERRMWEARRLTGPDEVQRLTAAILRRIPTPPARPPHHGAIQWDGVRDRLWVPEYRSETPWSDTLRITVASLEGGEEQNIHFPGMASVLDVGEDAALLLHRSDLDEETVWLVPLACG